MSYNSLHKCLIDNRLWATISIVLLGWYLSPLFHETFYVPVFDNLDSNVVWYKILAESGMIFAPNDAIIPNMMNGLPRSSYGSEFDIILWLYYFFEPKTAYIINEVAIHLIAFFSMFIFLKSYVVKTNKYYGLVPVYIGSLYFALLPYWSGAGATIALLPLVTYALLNIKNKKSTKWNWLLLVVLPIYSDFILLYMFYIIMAGLYMIYDAIQYKKLNKAFFFALFLMGTMFLLREYRLVISMFFDSGFISHRSEFDIFLNSSIMDSYRGGHVFFLNGHHQHLIDLQFPYVIPVILIGMLLSLSKRKFTKNESMLIWILVVLGFAVNIWSLLLTQLYSLPILTIFVLLVYLFTSYNRLIPVLFLLQIALAAVVFFFSCKCGHFLVYYLPILKELNVTRMAFVQPLIWTVLLTMVMKIYADRLKYTLYFLLLFVLAQSALNFNTKEFFNHKVAGYATFTGYYAPKLFAKLKKDIKPRNIHVVSFGLEPAISLYNNLYTVDGYSTNYPLSYKHKFKKVIRKYTDSDNKKFDNWGSKLYLMQVRGTPDIYEKLKGTVISNLLADIDALCALHTDYIISSYKFKLDNKNVILHSSYQDETSLWDIYVYNIKCK